MSTPTVIGRKYHPRDGWLAQSQYQRTSRAIGPTTGPNQTDRIPTIACDHRTKAGKPRL